MATSRERASNSRLNARRSKRTHRQSSCGPLRRMPLTTEPSLWMQLLGCKWNRGVPRREEHHRNDGRQQTLRGSHQRARKAILLTLQAFTESSSCRRTPQSREYTSFGKSCGIQKQSPKLIEERGVYNFFPQSETPTMT